MDTNPISYLRNYTPDLPYMYQLVYRITFDSKSEKRKHLVLGSNFDSRNQNPSIPSVDIKPATTKLQDPCWCRESFESSKYVANCLVTLVESDG